MYFQYEMGTADTVSRTVDALLNDWAQIVHLYSIVHELAEYFKMGALYIAIELTNHIIYALCNLQCLSLFQKNTTYAIWLALSLSVIAS